MINMLYEPFRGWSDGRSIWLYGDPHFGDPDCQIMDPAWPDIPEQISAINRCLQKNDTFICLGDVGNPSYIKEINAKHKVLIMGNHDSITKCEPYFDEIYSGPLFISKKILLSHEPVDMPFAVNMHGHDHHEKKMISGNSINLAANVCGYKPVNLSALIKQGVFSGVKDIHRLAIEYQIAHPFHKDNTKTEEVVFQVQSAQNLALFLKRSAMKDLEFIYQDEEPDENAIEEAVNVIALSTRIKNICKDYKEEDSVKEICIPLTKKEKCTISSQIEFSFFSTIHSLFEDGVVDNPYWAADILETCKKFR